MDIVYLGGSINCFETSQSVVVAKAVCSDDVAKIIIEAYAKPKLVIGMREHAQMIPFGCKPPIVSIISHDKKKWFLDDIVKPEWGVDVLNPNFRNELKLKALESLKDIENRINYIAQKQKELYLLSLKNVDEALIAIKNKI